MSRIKTRKLAEKIYGAIEEHNNKYDSIDAIIEILDKISEKELS